VAQDPPVPAWVFSNQRTLCAVGGRWSAEAAQHWKKMHVLQQQPLGLDIETELELLLTASQVGMTHGFHTDEFHRLQGEHAKWAAGKRSKGKGCTGGGKKGKGEKGEGKKDEKGTKKGLGKSAALAKGSQVASEIR
jgi:hypothetical protein